MSSALATWPSPSDTMVTLESVNCPLCDGEQHTPLMTASDLDPAGQGQQFTLVRCQDCKLVFTNPRPTPASIAQFYTPAYQPHRRPRKMRRSLRRWYKLMGMDRARCRERRSLPVQGLGRLLDFGCGGGSFLLRMAEQGWQVTGVDAASTAVESIQQELGLPALVGSLPHPALLPNSFDVVTMWHSLEHCHDPLGVLRAAHEVLTPQGRLLVSVPNIDSWPYQWFGPAWFGLDVPRHLIHFGPTTLQSMLEKAGFEVEELRFVRHADWLHSSAKQARRLQTGKSLLQLLRFKPLARLVSHVCYQADQADCLFAVARSDA